MKFKEFVETGKYYYTGNKLKNNRIDNYTKKNNMNYQTIGNIFYPALACSFFLLIKKNPIAPRIKYANIIK